MANRKKEVFFLKILVGKCLSSKTSTCNILFFSKEKKKMRIR